MYLALSLRDEQLVPVVVLRAGNTVARVELRQDGPYVKGIASTTGSTPVKGDYRLDWNKILANMERLDTPEQTVPNSTEVYSIRNSYSRYCSGILNDILLREEGEEEIIPPTLFPQHSLRIPQVAFRPRFLYHLSGEQVLKTRS